MVQNFIKIENKSVNDSHHLVLKIFCLELQIRNAQMCFMTDIDRYSLCREKQADSI